VTPTELRPRPERLQRTLQIAVGVASGRDYWVMRRARHELMHTGSEGRERTRAAAMRVALAFSACLECAVPTAQERSAPDQPRAFLAHAAMLVGDGIEEGAAEARRRSVTSLAEHQHRPLTPSSMARVPTIRPPATSPSRV